MNALWGFLLGMYGYGMPGFINLAVLETAFKGKRKQCVLIIISAVLSELVYSYASLFILEKFSDQTIFIFWCRIISIVLLLGMAWGSFHAQNLQEVSTGIIKRAYVAIVLHVQQIPFWLVWGTLLLQHDQTALKEGFWILLIFNALGTIAMLSLYAFYGPKLLNYWKFNTQWVNRAVGILSILIAVQQLYYVLN